jgi:Tfp pilus assembly protein FimT
VWSTSERRAHSGRPRRAGITLVEILIVLTLVGVAAGIGIEGLRSYREVERARGGAIQILNVISLAKARAVATNQIAIVDFSPGALNPQDGFYEVFLDTNRNGTRDPLEVAAANLSDPTERAGMIGYQLPADMTFGQPSAATGPLGIATASDGVTFANNQIVLLPDGTTTESGHVTLMDPDGRTFAVTVTGGGAIRMYRYDGSGWR